MKHTLSLAMIVKDEEEVLDRCLSSINEIVDELIIVDTGSKDKTKEIAQKYNAIIYDFKWIDDFSAARNFSFSKCTKDFILWLDADDVVKPKDVEKIKHYLDRDDWQNLLCKYIYFHDANDNPVLVLKRNRILKNDPSVKWNDPIHEYITHNLITTNCDIEIHHYRTDKGFLKNEGRNLRILKKLYKISKDPRHHYYYARELADSGKPKQAISLFKKYLKEKTDWEGNIINAYQRLAEIYVETNQVDKAIKLCLEAIEYNPNYIKIYNILSKIYYDQEKWDKVIRWCNIAKTIEKPDAVHSYYPMEYDFKPYDRLCFAYAKIGDIENSYINNEMALKSNPTGQDLKRCLFNKKHLEEIKKSSKKDGSGLKLNIGCGGKKIDGYLDVDVEETPFTDEVFSMTDIPYTSDTIEAIYCEHVIEHGSHQEANKAIQEFSRVLKPGGELQLFVPDLEKCCENYLNSKNNQYINGYQEAEWYKYTIFGIQKDENNVHAEHQFHKTGFSKKELEKLLESNDFVIDYIVNY